jgi:hypothetical protein
MNHYLLIYNRRTGKIIQRAEFNGQGPALSARFQAEREHHSDPDIEVVVLGAASWEALSRTHARYFRRVQELAGDAIENLPARG